MDFLDFRAHLSMGELIALKLAVLELSQFDPGHHLEVV